MGPMYQWVNRGSEMCRFPEFTVVCRAGWGPRSPESQPGFVAVVTCDLCHWPHRPRGSRGPRGRAGRGGPAPRSGQGGVHRAHSQRNDPKGHVEALDGRGSKPQKARCDQRRGKSQPLYFHFISCSSGRRGCKRKQMWEAPGTHQGCTPPTPKIPRGFTGDQRQAFPLTLAQEPPGQAHPSGHGGSPSILGLP